MTEDCSIVVILSKNKASPKGCSVRPTPFFLPTNWSRCKPSASVPYPNALSYPSAFPTLPVTSYSLYHLLFLSSSDRSLLSLPSSLLYLDILVSSHPLPSLGASIPPARLSSLNSCTPASAAFQLWLPSSCPGSCIANPFLFFFFYIYTP